MEAVQQINPYLDRIMQRIGQQRTQPITGTTITDYPSSLKECGLDNVDCHLCGNRGYLVDRDEEGNLRTHDCECMKRRRSLRNIADNNLQKLVQRYRMDNYETPTERQRAIKQKAMLFAKNNAEGFVITGKSGSGKTHICIAICSALIAENWQVRYVIWRTDAARLKAMVNEGRAYEQEINKLRNAAVLYIDDFFKGTVSEADINLAFTILNDRYNTAGKKTIISTELSMPELMKIDEAVAGRIAEMSRGFVLQSPDENWRVK